jgi:hypothetical protein
MSLNYHLALWGYILNDVKDFAPHFGNIGSRHLPRVDYDALLGEYGDAAPTSNPRVQWRTAATLAEIVNASSAITTVQNGKAKTATTPT